MSHTFDIIIIGGGIIGLTTACALARSPWRIAVIDQQPLQRVSTTSLPFSARTTAITHTTKRFLQTLNIWPHLTRYATYQQVLVEEENGTQLDFDAQALHFPDLGCVIEQEIWQQALLITLSEHPSVQLFANTTPQAIHFDTSGMHTIKTHHATLTAHLILATDGAPSWARGQAGIEVERRAYAQSAIITTLQAEESHHACAYQKFLTTGPLALLPLSDPHWTSLVWTLPTALAEQHQSESESFFCQRLESLVGHRLGAISALGKRHCIPLFSQQAKTYLRSGFALLGDAAHTVHPLAGQGINFGISDVRALSEILLTDTRTPLIQNLSEKLRRYARRRKAENTLNALTIDSLQKIFCWNTPWLRDLRRIGLAQVDSCNWIKRWLAERALS